MIGDIYNTNRMQGSDPSNAGNSTVTEDNSNDKHTPPQDDFVKSLYEPSDMSNFTPAGPSLEVHPRSILDQPLSGEMQGQKVKEVVEEPAEYENVAINQLEDIEGGALPVVEVNQDELPESLRKKEDTNLSHEKHASETKEPSDPQHVDYGLNTPTLPGLSVRSVMVYPSKWVIINRIFVWTLMVFFILFAFSVMGNWLNELIGVRSVEDVINSRAFLLFSGIIFYILGCIFIAYKWLVISYEIKPMQVLFTYNGIFRKDRKIYSLVSMDSLNLDQGPLGKLFNYGTLHIVKPAHREEEQIVGIPDPEHYMVIVNNASQMPQEGNVEEKSEDFK